MINFYAQGEVKLSTQSGLVISKLTAQRKGVRQTQHHYSLKYNLWQFLNQHKAVNRKYFRLTISYLITKDSYVPTSWNEHQYPNRYWL